MLSQNILFKFLNPYNHNVYIEPVPVKSVEVLISFLVADDTAGFINAENHFNVSDLQRYIKDRFSYYKNQELKNLELRISYKNRLKRLSDHRWFLQTIPLKYIGSWPGVGDLPKDWCDLSVIDICKRIESLPSTLHTVQKIHSMVPYISEILHFTHPILVMGSEIRDADNTQLLPFDLDDGSHRCIAAALSGIKEIDCYVGLA